MEPVRTVTGTAVAARPLRRRHRPDHPQRLAQAGRTHRLRRRPVLRLARRPRLRAQPARARRRGAPGRRAQLRHRLVARARVWALHGLRLPGRGLAPLRRHLPHQLHQGGPGARAGRRRPSVPPCCAAVEADPTLEITVDVEARTLSAPGAGIEPPSPSTTSPAGASSKASTTSASPSATRTPSPPTRRAARMASHDHPHALGALPGP